MILLLFLSPIFCGCINDENNIDYSKGELELSISSNRKYYSISNESIYSIQVEGIIINVGNTTVRVQPIVNGLNFHLNITNSSDHTFGVKYPYDPKKFRNEDLCKIEPGENISINIFLISSYWIPTNITDTYTITGQYHPSKRGLIGDAKNSWAGTLYSNHIIIEIVK